MGEMGGGQVGEILLELCIKKELVRESLCD